MLEGISGGLCTLADSDARDLLLSLSYHQNSKLQELAASHLARVHAFHPQETAAAAVELVRLMDHRVTHDKEAIKEKLKSNEKELDKLVPGLPEKLKVMINVGLSAEPPLGVTKELKETLDGVGVQLKPEELNDRVLFRLALSELRKARKTGSRDETVDKVIRLLEERIQLLTLASQEAGTRSGVTPPPIISVLARIGLDQLKSEKSEVLTDPAYGNVGKVIDGMWKKAPDLSETAKVDPKMLNLLTDKLTDTSLRAHYAGVITLKPDGVSNKGGPLSAMVAKHLRKPDMKEGLVNGDNSAKKASTIFNVRNEDTGKYVTVIFSDRTASILNTRPEIIDDLTKHDDFVTKLYSKLRNMKINSSQEHLFKNLDRINYKSPEIYDSKDNNNIHMIFQNEKKFTDNLWLDPDSNITIKKKKESALINNDGVFGLYLSEYLKRNEVAGNSTSMVHNFLRDYEEKSNKDRLAANRAARMNLLVGAFVDEHPYEIPSEYDVYLTDKEEQ